MLEPKERLQFFEKLMGYTLPKLQAVQYTTDIDRMINGLSDEQLNFVIDQLTKRHNENEGAKD
jgi:hypothetical protein